MENALGGVGCEGSDKGRNPRWFGDGRGDKLVCKGKLPFGGKAAQPKREIGKVGCGLRSEEGMNFVFGEIRRRIRFKESSDEGCGSFRKPLKRDGADGVGREAECA